jgi:hypothetical protein
LFFFGAIYVGPEDVIRHIADHKKTVRTTTIFAVFWRVFSRGFCVPSDIAQELSTRWRAVMMQEKEIAHRGSTQDTKSSKITTR